MVFRVSAVGPAAQKGTEVSIIQQESKAISDLGTDVVGALANMNNPDDPDGRGHFEGALDRGFYPSRYVNRDNKVITDPGAGFPSTTSTNGDVASISPAARTGGENADGGSADTGRGK